jgi:hypothetical protein
MLGYYFCVRKWSNFAVMLANIRLMQGRLSSVDLLVKMARFVKK